jgi:hypothetical protein
MPEPDQPIDGEFGLAYQIVIMRKMIGELPPDLAKLFENQLDEIVKALENRFAIVKSTVGDHVSDARLAILNMEFDLHATRNERDELKKRLGED